MALLYIYICARCEKCADWNTRVGNITGADDELNACLQDMAPAAKHEFYRNTKDVYGQPLRGSLEQ